MTGPVSRRGLLLAVPRAFSQADDDVALLTAAVSLEQVAAGTYATLRRADATPVSTGRILRRLERQEREHAEVLGSTLDALDRSARVPEAPASQAELVRLREAAGLVRELAPLRGEVDVVGVALELENALMAGYHNAIGKLRDARTVTVMTQVMAAEAQHATVLRGRLSDDPAVLVPDAFESGDASIP